MTGERATGAASSPPAKQGRATWPLVSVLVLLTLVAWAWTLRDAWTPSRAVTDMGGAATGGMSAMAGMAGSGDAVVAPTADASVAGLATFLAAWTVMMAAMMLPAASPMLTLYDRMTRRDGTGAPWRTWLFGIGYLGVWAAVGGVAWLAGRATGAGMTAGLAAGRRPLALGAVLVVAGAYQFTPLKQACLRHCQSPLGFLMTHWHGGAAGALRMGLEHGAYCLGCCWVLFALLVAVGTMSVPWMLLLTLLVTAEKLLPHGARIGQVVGGAMIVLGVLVAAGVVGMPWIAPGMAAPV